MTAHFYNFYTTEIHTERLIDDAFCGILHNHAAQFTQLYVRTAEDDNGEPGGTVQLLMIDDGQPAAEWSEAVDLFTLLCNASTSKEAAREYRIKCLQQKLDRIKRELEQQGVPLDKVLAQLERKTQGHGGGR